MKAIDQFSKGVTRRIAAAREMFEAFTGRDARSLRHYELVEDDVLFEVGKCDAIAYTVNRNGQNEHYEHEFNASSRPVLCCSSDGRRLYLLAGAYKFTHRGIEDR